MLSCSLSPSLMCLCLVLFHSLCPTPSVSRSLSVSVSLSVSLSLCLSWSHSQASEQDILKYVVKWGEQQLIKRMADRGKIIHAIITPRAPPHPHTNSHRHAHAHTLTRTHTTLKALRKLPRYQSLQIHLKAPIKGCQIPFP